MCESHINCLGFLCRVPVDPLEWQISQDTANSIAACLANTIGAAESVLRVAATGHDKRLFFKVTLLLWFYFIIQNKILEENILNLSLSLYNLGSWMHSWTLIFLFFQSFSVLGCTFYPFSSLWNLLLPFIQILAANFNFFTLENWGSFFFFLILCHVVISNIFLNFDYRRQKNR